MKKTSEGFTLIELMIVVAIVGFLAAVAIPAFQTYVARGQVSEALSLFVGASNSIENFVSETGTFPSDLATLNILGVKQTGEYVSSLTIGSYSGSVGTLIITFNTSEIAQSVKGRTIEFAREIDGTWTCRTGGPNPIDIELLPQSCH